MKDTWILHLLKYLSLFAIILCACGSKQSPAKVNSTTTTTPSFEFEDRSWLTGQPCRAPCWYGLTPGTTDMSTAQKFVNRIPFIDSNRILVKGNSLFLYCKQPEKELCTNLYFKNNKLVKIWMNIKFPVTLAETVDNIGTPDYLSYKPITPNKTPPDDCFLELFWVSRQMTVRYYDHHSNHMCQEIKNARKKPSPDLPVHEVWYLLPDRFVDLNVNDGYYQWDGFIGDE